MEKIIEVADPQRVSRPPDKTIVLMSDGNFLERNHVVKNVILNQYVQKHDPTLGPYSIITVLVETDKGVIEMTYDEGWRGANALTDAATFLKAHLGISGLILRSIIQLDQSMNKNNLLVLDSDHQDPEYYEV